MGIWNVVHCSRIVNQFLKCIIFFLDTVTVVLYLLSITRMSQEVQGNLHHQKVSTLLIASLTMRKKGRVIFRKIN